MPHPPPTPGGSGGPGKDVFSYVKDKIDESLDVFKGAKSATDRITFIWLMILIVLGYIAYILYRWYSK